MLGSQFLKEWQSLLISHWKRGFSCWPVRCSSIRPEDMGQIFYPSSFHVIQPFLESVHYYLVNSLGLSIYLRISWSEIPICDSKITTVSLKRFPIKLKAIVWDEGMKDPEPCDNIFRNKFLGIHVLNICQRFSFNLLGEVVCANQQISLVSYCFRERANNI